MDPPSREATAWQARINTNHSNAVPTCERIRILIPAHAHAHFSTTDPTDDTDIGKEMRSPLPFAAEAICLAARSSHHLDSRIDTDIEKE